MMLSKFQIERMIDGGMDQQLIRRVLGNGRGLDAEVLLSRLDRFSERAVALALAVQRLDELTYGPDRSLDRLLRALLLLQERGGAFPGRADQSTAIATAAALSAMVRRRDRAGALGEPVDQRLDNAIESAAAALGASQGADGILCGDIETSEIALCLLGSAATSFSVAAFSMTNLRDAVARDRDRRHWTDDEAALGTLALACAA